MLVIHTHYRLTSQPSCLCEILHICGGIKLVCHVLFVSLLILDVSKTLSNTVKAYDLHVL
jgi:hypothetical protein